MNVEASPSGDLTLGHLLAAAGVDDSSRVLVIRHTYSVDGLRDQQDVTLERVRDYVREQNVGAMKFPKSPPPLWLNFMADGGRRARFFATYENHGEAVEGRNSSRRYYHLQDHHLLASLSQRLVIEWSRDTINWAKRGNVAANLPVLEVADPQVVPFPGFDQVLISYSELQAVVADSAL